ncbi:GspH/FimT family pseudopilin [Rheinheimera sp.]|uniref:GspH/FimT family pseudopilin n=1 Tax=Rheinheimera sp. TaxID=1869214 RepID=UPI0027BAC7DA|nr:GspH/FimT family pseudopilin [Rheinheimera sp.]
MPLKIPNTRIFAIQRQRRFIAGFSLLELMIVLNLLLLLLLIGMPSLQEMMARQQAESYVRQLKQQLQYARVEAISSGTTVTFCPLQGSQCVNQWWQIPIQILRQTPGSGVLAKLQQLDRPQNSHWLYYNRELLQFRRDGSLNMLQNGTFIYCAKQYRWHYKLSISQAGRSQLNYVDTPCPQ